ncbi:S41 family peptidase [Rhizosphaericola mali]|uniref:Tail specific protease domain-containing protein n=1 Tax=Rhizosphaericola mali TaxID=2545455 RepID=A0A5P2G6M4_9BACT|nr:S41 family peptidase [Rhizosphaericola mali]QES89440.1 hypothetical protein E0W69_012450 [Rhizosphaericola mali]
MKYIIASLFVLFSIDVFAQKCNCKEEFQWMKKTFEQNDAGFQYVFNKKGKEDYEKLNSKTLAALDTFTDPNTCAEIMLNWLHYFRNGHLGIRVNDSNTVKSGPRRNPTFSIVDKNTILLTIPTFGGSYKKQIDSIIETNKSLLSSKENLILDIRDNGGGSDISYEKIIPYLYTNPITNYRAQYYSTKLNNQRMLELANNYKKYGISEKMANQFRINYDTLNKHLGDYINLDKDSITIDTLNNILPFPKHVAILVNENNGSTAEEFLLTAKQSQKVKLFGHKTAGVLDFSNLWFTNSPSGIFKLTFALTKSYRIPDFTIDGQGILPDLPIGNSVPDNQWIEYVVRILENK